jgi:hypothetical protein
MYSTSSTLLLSLSLLLFFLNLFSSGKNVDFFLAFLFSLFVLSVLLCYSGPHKQLETLYKGQDEEGWLAGNLQVPKEERKKHREKKEIRVTRI